MLAVTEHGDGFVVDDQQTPEELKRYLWNETYLFHENVELINQWVATVCAYDWNKKKYKYVGEKMYDHEPTKSEILWLMGKYDVVRNGYVIVDKVFCVQEKDDECAFYVRSNELERTWKL